MEQLAEASLEVRRNAPLAEAIAERALLSIAVNARSGNEVVIPRSGFHAPELNIARWRRAA